MIYVFVGLGGCRSSLGQKCQIQKWVPILECFSYLRFILEDPMHNEHYDKNQALYPRYDIYLVMPKTLSVLKTLILIAFW